MLGVQSINQLFKRYGHDETVSLLDLLNTRLFFHSTDSSVAKWASEQLGKEEIIRPQESISYGANRIRDGVSLSQQHSERQLVSADDISSLKDLSCYTRTLGDLPVVPLDLRHQKRPVIAAQQVSIKAGKQTALDKTLDFYCRQNAENKGILQTSPFKHPDFAGAVQQAFSDAGNEKEAVNSMPEEPPLKKAVETHTVTLDKKNPMDISNDTGGNGADEIDHTLHDTTDDF